MSEPRKQAALGLGDTNIDPDILIKEIDHDFFDDPLGGGEEAVMCQVAGGEEIKLLNTMPNGGEAEANNVTSEPNSSSNGLLMRLEDETELIERMVIANGGTHHEQDSGRSSSNITIHLELGKDEDEQTGGAEGGQSSSVEDFYSIQSNANYPRPKESYQLQQRRRSFGTIQQPQRNSSSNAGGKGEHFQPMNIVDGLNGHFGDLSSTDSSNSSSSNGGVAAGGEEEDDDESDSDLSDSSESELESLDTDDEEFVDMLEKYFDYIDPDTDCSDLTEVSPLSSLAASPLPPSFYTGEGDMFQIPGDLHQSMNIISDDELCLTTGALHISGAFDDMDGDGDDEDDPEEEEEEPGDATGFASTGEIDVAVAAVTAIASAVPAAAKLLERDVIRGGKPRLPLVISTTETVIIPAEESDDDNNAPGSMSISIAGTCGTSVDLDDVDDPPPEEADGEFGERDPRATENKELDVCFNCCVMEHAKKILSRESSPSRKIGGWLAKQQMEEGNGNSGGNGNGDELGGGLANGGAVGGVHISRSKSTWNGKVRAGSSNSATSSSSSTTTGSSSTFGSGASGASGSGGGLRRAQKNFSFTPEQMRKIERENHILLRKILDTHQKGYHHGHHHSHCHNHRCRHSGHHHAGHHGHQNRAVSSSTSIARLRQQKRIDHENAILMRKLQTVKPSKEIGDAFGKPLNN